MKTYRQSLVTSFEQCARRALLGMEIDDDLTTGNMGASADLGSAFHAVVAEILRTLYRQGETQMPTQEAVEVMRETLAGGSWILPADERDDLRWMVLGFCKYEWSPQRIMSLEQRLGAEIVCPDGEIRTLTGQPDLLMADPPDGIICCDWKSGRGKPRSPRDNPDAEIATGKQYLSDRGHAQLDQYGLLALRNYPQASRVILRELHMRSGQIREAVLGREELEHVEWEVGLHLMKLDQAIGGGEEYEALRRPRPGTWCARACPVQASCPIPAEQRGVGALDGPETADKAAARFVVVDGLRNTLREQLRTYYEQSGRAAEVGDGTAAFWRPKPDGRGRNFGVFPVEDIPAPPPEQDVEALLTESLAQVRDA